MIPHFQCQYHCHCYYHCCLYHSLVTYTNTQKVGDLKWVYVRQEWCLANSIMLMRTVTLPSRPQTPSPAREELAEYTACIEL
jgi:hypothetical protein